MSNGFYRQAVLINADTFEATPPLPLHLLSLTAGTWLEIQLPSNLHESLNNQEALLPSKKWLKTPDILFNFWLINSQHFDCLQMHFLSKNVAFLLLWWCGVEIWRRGKHVAGFGSCVQRAQKNLLQDFSCLEAWRKPLQNSPFPLPIAVLCEHQYEIILFGRGKPI